MGDGGVWPAGGLNAGGGMVGRLCVDGGRPVCWQAGGRGGRVFGGRCGPVGEVNLAGRWDGRVFGQSAYGVRLVWTRMAVRRVG